MKLGIENLCERDPHTAPDCRLATELSTNFESKITDSSIGAARDNSEDPESLVVGVLHTDSSIGAARGNSEGLESTVV